MTGIDNDKLKTTGLPDMNVKVVLDLGSKMLWEDPTLKEDQVRLQRCEDFFTTLATQGLCGSDADLAVIIGFLHDTWSVIRNKCGRLLGRKLRLTDHALYKIVDSLCDAVDARSHPWQVIHGSIIGLDALVQYVSDTAVQQKVISLCLFHIGHIRTPIREDARKCLVSLQRITPNKRTLLSRIIQTINSLLQGKLADEVRLSGEHGATYPSVGDSVVVEGTEEEVLTLDGLLGCLSDNYHHFPELLQLEEGIDSHESNGEFTSLQVVDAMKMCMEHGASSVRQKGGQVLSIILMSFLKFAKTSDCSDDAALNSPFGTVKPLASASAEFVDYILSNVLIPGIESDEYGSWSTQEISLMISEELIKELISIQQQLADLSASVRAEAFSTKFTASSDTNAGDSAVRELLASDNGSEGADKTNEGQPQSRPNFSKKLSLENVSDELAVHAKFGTIRQMTSLLRVLKNRIPVLLCHEKFEVRRMALQLMPYLARTLVLMDLNHRHLIDFSASPDAATDQPSDRLSTDFNQRDSNSTNDSETDADRYATPAKTKNGASRADHAADSTTRPFSRRISRAVTHSGTGTVLDLMLMAQMVWTGEIIKENQHIFEAFPVDDCWESHAAVKLIHMRSMSRDNQMLQALEQMSVASFSSSRNLTSASMPGLITSEHHLRTSSLKADASKSFENDLSAVGRAVDVEIEIKDDEDNDGGDDDYDVENGDKIDTSLNGVDVPRGVVDNWSLDGRGRLMELESRSLFHKFIKSVARKDSWKATSRLVNILISNCKLIMKNIEDMIQNLERLLFREVLQQQNSIALPAIFASSSNAPENCLSTDFVEVFALVKSFLLSAKYRFLHSEQLKNYIPMTRETMVRAAALLPRWDAFMIAWMRRVVQVQANACCTSNETANQTQQRGIIGGVSRDRWGSSVLLYRCLNRGTLRDGNSKGSPDDLKLSMLTITCRYSESMRTADAKCAAPESLSNDPHQEIPKVPASTSASTVIPPTPPHPAPAPLLTVLNSNFMASSPSELPNLVIIPSLAEAGTNPAIYLESTALHDFMKSAVASRRGSVTTTPPHSSILHRKYSFGISSTVPPGLTVSVASVLNSTWPRDGERIIVPPGGSLLPSEVSTAANSAVNSTVSSPTKVNSAVAQNIVSQYHLGNHQVPDEIAHGKSPSIRYQSMDRWNCEAVAPVLYCIANSLTDEKESLCLASITIEWILSALMNPLWLDNRIGAKKNLFDGLVVLLSNDPSERRSKLRSDFANKDEDELDEEHDTCKSLEEKVSARLNQLQQTPVQPAARDSPGPSDIYMLLLAVRIVRAIAEALSLRSSNGLTPRGGYGEKLLLDLKCLLCLVRSAVKGIVTSVRYYLTLDRYFTSLTTEGSANDNSNGGVVTAEAQNNVVQQLHSAWAEIKRNEISPLYLQCNTLFLDAIRYYKDKFPAVENMQEISEAIDITAQSLSVRSRSGSSINWGMPVPMGVSGIGLLPQVDMVAAADYLTGVSNNASPNKASDIGSLPGPQGAEAEEDEFSDWDEEEDAEEGIPAHTDSTANMHQTYLTARLWKDMQQLEIQLRIWDMYINKSNSSSRNCEDGSN